MFIYLFILLQDQEGISFTCHTYLANLLSIKIIIKLNFLVQNFGSSAILPSVFLEFFAYEKIDNTIFA